MVYTLLYIFLTQKYVSMHMHILQLVKPLDEDADTRIHVSGNLSTHSVTSSNIFLGLHNFLGNRCQQYTGQDNQGGRRKTNFRLESNPGLMTSKPATRHRATITRQKSVPPFPLIIWPCAVNHPLPLELLDVFWQCSTMKVLLPGVSASKTKRNRSQKKIQQECQVAYNRSAR